MRNYRTEFNNQDGNEYYWQYVQKQREYGLWYNDFTKKKSALTAISVLSQNKSELEKRFQNLIDEIKQRINGIKSKIKDHEEGDPELHIAAWKVLLSLADTFPYTEFYRANEVNREALARELTEYCQKVQYSDTIAERLNEKLRQAYQIKENVERIGLAYKAIKNIINRVLDEGYPNSLELSSSDNMKENKGGRPLDNNADQSEIERVVLLLIKKGIAKEPGHARFWHFTGKFKGQPNKNQLKKEIIQRGLAEDITERTVLNRIDKVIDCMK